MSKIFVAHPWSHHVPFRNENAVSPSPLIFMMSIIHVTLKFISSEQIVPSKQIGDKSSRSLLAFLNYNTNIMQDNAF